MRGDDPDAMWRPGFTGELVYPTSSAAAIGRARRLRRVAAVLGAVVAIGLVAVGVVVVTSDGSTTERGSGISLPDDPVEQWSVELPGLGSTILAGSARTVVLAANSRSREVVALDGVSGTERWTAGAPGAADDELDVVLLGRIVIVVSRGATEQHVIAVDAADGRQRWEVALPPTAGIVTTSTIEVTDVDGSGIALLDPRTGRTAATIDGPVELTRRFVARRDGSDVEVHDRRTLELVARADLSALSLDETMPISVAATGGRVVVAWRDGVALVDGDVVVDSVRLARPPDETARVTAEALDAAGGTVVVEQGDRVSVLAVTAEGLDVRWADDALLFDWRETAAGGVVLAVSTLNSSIPAMPIQLLDAVTGRAVGRGASSVEGLRRFGIFADDGYVDQTFVPGVTPVLVGYDLFGAERWRTAVPAGTSVVLIDEGVLAVDHSSSDAALVTLYA